MREMKPVSAVTPLRSLEEVSEAGTALQSGLTYEDELVAKHMHMIALALALKEAGLQRCRKFRVKEEEKKIRKASIQNQALRKDVQWFFNLRDGNDEFWPIVIAGVLVGVVVGLALAINFKTPLICLPITIAALGYLVYLTVKSSTIKSLVFRDSSMATYLQTHQITEDMQERLTVLKRVMPGIEISARYCEDPATVFPYIRIHDKIWYVEKS